MSRILRRLSLAPSSWALELRPSSTLEFGADDALGLGPSMGYKLGFSFGLTEVGSGIGRWLYSCVLNVFYSCPCDDSKSTAPFGICELQFIDSIASRTLVQYSTYSSCSTLNVNVTFALSKSL